ncbi:ACT domain-containing protein [Rhodobacterales bacterium HKCCE2091]|nr:ACT domain-containing protein [Rhodobacterales bacterium HKCCE2091]
MSERVSDRQAMIAGMAPEIVEGHFVYAVSSDDRLAAHAFAVIREAEGTTLILPEPLAAAEGLETEGPFVCITLSVQSALEGVGLTAAVSTALADAGIPANMVAGYHHDHVFVPAAEADRALSVLNATAAAAT